MARTETTDLTSAEVAIVEMLEPIGTANQQIRVNAGATSLEYFTPSAGAGDMVLASTQTVSGLKTFLASMFALRNVANTFSAYFTNTNTADRTYTLKDANGTIAFTSDITGTNSGTNTGDQASIVGITGTFAQFNTAVTDADLARTDAANTFTGVQTMTSPNFTTPVLGTPTSGTLTNCTGLPLAGVVDSTTEALGVGSLELGHATDTTITRVSAGVIAVEGVIVPAIAPSTSGNVMTSNGSNWVSSPPTGGITTADAYIANRIFL